MTTHDDINTARAEREAAARSASDAIGESFGRTKPRRQNDNELPLRSRGEPMEGVAIWAAKERAASAVKELTEAILRGDSSKGIYVAEAEAKAAAVESYSAAAASSQYEDTRQEAVAAAVSQLAQAAGSAINGR